jgi:glycosyltransferase involved in cell wall biosynthesis
MLNVTYDHQVFGFQEYGGVSKYFYELARRVAATEGFAASIAAPLYVNRYVRDAEARFKVRGLRIPLVPKTGRLVRTANHRMSQVLFAISRPDLVHETYYQKTAAAPKGCPVVITVHDMIHDKFKGDFKHDDPTSARKLAAVMRADRIICVSENTRADLIELFDPDPAKIRTIHHGFSAVRTIEPAVHPALPRPFFLYVGQRGGYKNFANLLTAYASSGRVNEEFDLVAFGVSAFTRQETDAIRAAGLDSEQVRHLSGDDALLAHLYRKATALIYPSLYEGFGIPPLEAMSYGCPVLCSNTSSIPEVVGDAGLFFDPRSVEAMRESMERVVSSPELRSDLIERGTQRVKHFSYDRCATETMDVYREIARYGRES